MNSHEYTNEVFNNGYTDDFFAADARIFFSDCIKDWKTNNMTQLIYNKESYKIIGICMEVHNNLGPGFLEIVYKDALEYEFKLAGIPFSREQKYEVKYKDIILPHDFYADFVVFDKIILEVQGIKGIPEEYIARTINYLKVSGNKLGLLVNFGELKLEYKRLILDQKIRNWRKLKYDS